MWQVTFFIFQALGYTIDVYRDDIDAEKILFRYALFVSFFPQLVAGPIERSRNLLEQLRKNTDFDVDNAKEGLLTIAYGLFLKIVIADNLSKVVDRVFDSPYMSMSVKEFWKRWHMSLNTWFVDYLYIPLGGSRKGLFRKYINTLIIFICSGLWHGASWHYLVWGLLNGIFIVIEDIINPTVRKIGDKLGVDSNRKVIGFIKRLWTFILMTMEK